MSEQDRGLGPEPAWQTALDDLYQSVPVAFFSVGANGRIVGCNQRAADLLGYSAEELAGRPVIDLYADGPHGKPIARELLRRFQAGEEIHDQLLQMIAADGRPIWINLSVNAVRDAQGRIVASRSVVVDVSERVEAEQELRQERETLALVNTLNHAANRGESLEAIIDLFRRQARDVFGTHDATVYLVSPDKEYLLLPSPTLPAGTAGRIEKLIGRKLPEVRIRLAPGGVYTRILQGGQPRITDDPAVIQQMMAECTESKTLRRLVPAVSRILNYRSVMSVPLVIDGEAVGLVDMSLREPFSESDLARFAVMAEQLTAILRRRRTEQALQQSLEETVRGRRLLLTLSQAAQAVQRARTPDAVYHTIGQHAAEMGLEATVFTLTEDRMHLVVSHVTLRSDLVRAAEKLTGLSAQGHRFPLTPGGFFQGIIDGTETVYSYLDHAAVAEALPRSLGPLVRRVADLLGQNQSIIAPLATGGVVRGLLAITGADLAESDVPAVTAFANQAAIAIENARLYQETQQLAAFSQSIVQSMAEGIVQLDAEGSLTFVNPAMAALLGYSADELIGLHWSAVVPADQQPIVQSAIERHTSGQPGRYELELACRDGRRVPVLVSSDPRLEQGQFAANMAVFTEITELKRAEAERESLLARVRAQARQVQQIVQTVPEAMLLLDASGRVVLANPVAEEYLALLSDAQPDQALARLGDRSLAELLTSPPTRGLWHEIGAGARAFEAIARPIENGPQPENWVLIIRDVTQERETQQRLQQQERLAAVGQLAAGIAHDFNNILAVIVLYTQMALRAPDLSPKTRRQLETVAGQTGRATSLIQQILDFSRRAVLERRPLDLKSFLSEVVRLLERTLPENIRISVAWGTDDHTVNVDPTRLQQAVMNLVLNARDAMPAGGELRLALARVGDRDQVQCVTCGQVMGGDWVCLAVTDTGSGIPPDVLAHIFEPFFTTRPPGQGTGLGLAQVYGIVKQHHGHIGVATAVGRGTTISVYLPTWSTPPPPMADLETAVYAQGQGEAILVVEDDAALRAAMVDTLELLNYRALSAADGRQALEILEQPGAEVALVLSDLVMPEMGGQALFHAMRQRGLAVPMVVLSGHPIESELESLAQQGLAGWMPKPPSPGQLAQMLALVLRPESDQ